MIEDEMLRIMLRLAIDKKEKLLKMGNSKNVVAAIERIDLIIQDLESSIQ